jgi:hypothetical protein
MRSLNRNDRILCALYAALALVALVGTQTLLVVHLGRHHDHGAGAALVTDTLANPASTFAVVDLLVVAIVCLVFMVGEAKRLQIRRVWIYVALTFLIAISVSFPLFLIARQLRIAALRTS